MHYKPNFCGNCGESIERFSWKPWTSTRFCEICESDHRFIDWFPSAGILLSVLFGLFGFGSYLKSPEKPLIIAKNQLVAVSSNKSNIEQNSNSTKSENKAVVSNSTPTNNLANRSQIKESQNLPNGINSSEVKQNEAEQTVYFCGAQTKKGNPCTRKVKIAGRCWQHAGQSAMLPKEKLVTR